MHFHTRLFQNKYFEFQTDFPHDSDYFNIHLKWKKESDHAGISFYFEVFGFSLSAEIYDNRHWNYENNCWETE